LHEPTEPAIVPPSRIQPDPYRRIARRRGLPLWGRILLVLLTGPWIAVFITAACLYPYREDGTALTMETHRQLGLPPCTFKELTGLPCPSCGMTTSFALLMRGDVWHSVQANFVGTLLASLGLLFVPWALVSAWRGRFLFFHAIDMVAFRLAILFIILIFGRWGIALLLAFYATRSG
jgi:Protein of unknown function (DUF2752)